KAEAAVVGIVRGPVKKGQVGHRVDSGAATAAGIAERTPGRKIRSLARGHHPAAQAVCRLERCRRILLFPGHGIEWDRTAPEQEADIMRVSVAGAWGNHLKPLSCKIQ